MTEPVVVKKFKNGGSWAIRIPAHMLAESDSFEIKEVSPGVLEVRPHEPPLSIIELLDQWAAEPPVEDADEEFPNRENVPLRFPELDEPGA